MKEITAFTCLALIIIFSACNKKDNPSPPPSGKISVSRTAIRVDTTLGATDTFVVHSTVPWTATLSPSTAQWLRLDKTNGGIGDSVVRLTVLSNIGVVTSGQAATITIAATNNYKADPASVTVTQMPYTISLKWQRTLGGTADDGANALVKTADGGMAIAGYTYSNDGDVTANHGNYDFWVVKLDSSGGKQWAKTYGGSSADICYHITSAADGGYLLAGSTLSNDGDVSGNHGKTDAWVVKTDGSGAKQWTKTFGGSGDDYAFAVTTNATGGFSIAGATTSSDGDVTGYHGGPYDILAVSMDGSGNKIWAKTLGGSGTDYALSITSTNDGGCAIAGWTGSNDGDVTGNHGNTDAWVVKLNSSSGKQWAKAMGGTGTEDFRGIFPTADGYMMAGRTNSNDRDVTGNHGIFDIWAVRVQVQ